MPEPITETEQHISYSDFCKTLDLSAGQTVLALLNTKSSQQALLQNSDGSLSAKSCKGIDQIYDADDRRWHMPDVDVINISYATVAGAIPRFADRVDRPRELVIDFSGIKKVDPESPEMNLTERELIEIASNQMGGVKGFHDRHSADHAAALSWDDTHDISDQNSGKRTLRRRNIIFFVGDKEVSKNYSIAGLNGFLTNLQLAFEGEINAHPEAVLYLKKLEVVLDKELSFDSDTQKSLFKTAMMIHLRQLFAAKGAERQQHLDALVTHIGSHKKTLLDRFRKGPIAKSRQVAANSLVEGLLDPDKKTKSTTSLNGLQPESNSRQDAEYEKNYARNDEIDKRLTDLRIRNVRRACIVVTKGELFATDARNKQAGLVHFGAMSAYIHTLNGILIGVINDQSTPNKQLISTLENLSIVLDELLERDFLLDRVSVTKEFSADRDNKNALINYLNPSSTIQLKKQQNNLFIDEKWRAINLLIAIKTECAKNLMLRESISTQ